MNQTRRRFMIGSGATIAACAGSGALGQLPSRVFASEESAEFPQPCSMDSWKREGVVLRPDQPWEDQYIEAFMSTVEPLDKDRWRIWYGANSPKTGYIGIGIADGVPGETFVKHRAVLSKGEPDKDAEFAIGNIDPNWRLASPTHIHCKDGRHLLYFFADGPRVQRYLVTESKDGKRYKVVDPERPCLYTYQDGTNDKKFHPGQTLKDIQCNDGATVYQLPDGTFEMFVQAWDRIAETDPRYVAHDNIKGWWRFIDRLTSEDGIKFDQRQRKVLVPDKDDPIDTQFYQLTVTHTPRGRVGLVGWYRVRDGYMELQYCFSKDGIHWDRVRKPWIPRGKEGDPDSVTVYPPSSIVHRDNKWWLFYTGVNYTHSTLQTPKPNDKPVSCVMLATTPSLWRT